MPDQPFCWTNGCLSAAQWLPSPNCDQRPGDSVIDLVVIHAISLPPDHFGGSGIVDLFTNQLCATAHPYYQAIVDLKVSAHFLIRRDGQLVQFVNINQRAWHAGVSQWVGRARCNDFSIGIELEGSDYVPFEAVQYHVLVLLLQAVVQACPIRQIVGHADIAPGRKTDPGPFFDWSYLRELLSGLLPDQVVCGTK